jgi:predicted acyl esterase
LLNATTVINGYQLDPAAQIDLVELRYQWFDYVFKSAPKPAILKDKVNYEVMGANVWKHARSFAAMANQTLRFHLSTVRSDDAYRLTEQNPAGDAFVAQTVDLADRTDVDRISASSSIVGNDNIVNKKLDPWNSRKFISDPLPKPTEVSGLFSGRLHFVANKKDLDFCVQLYELTPLGEYVLLSYYMQRASYVRDRSQRRLLTPGKPMQLDFKSERLTSRECHAGSRLIVMLGIVKQPDIQINYGTGKDVSSETIADSKEPLKIEWFNDSFIDLPARR